MEARNVKKNAINFEKVQEFGTDSAIVKEIKDSFTPAEIGRLVSLVSGFGLTTLPGEIDEEKVAQYKHIHGMDLANLMIHAQSLKAEGVRNPFDIQTFYKEDTHSVVVGQNKVILAGNEQKELQTYNGVVGGHRLGSIIANSVGCVVKSVNSLGAKTNTYHKGNEFAVKPGFSDSIAQIANSSARDVTSALNIMQQVDNANAQVQEGLIKLINVVVPSIPVMSEGRSKTVPLYVVGNLKRENGEYKKIPNSDKLYPPPISFYVKPFSPVALEGEQDGLCKELEKYNLGLSLPTVKRAGKNMYLGVPISECKFEHVIALHDAGVTPGDRILVRSSDENLIAMLRSNFGNTIWGIGMSEMMVDPRKVSCYYFDYVYYPQPLPYAYSGNYRYRTLGLRTALAAMLLDAVGKVILHIPPVALFDETIATMLQVEVRKGPHKELMKLGMTAGTHKEGMTYSPINLDDLKRVPLCPIFPQGLVKEFKEKGEEILQLGSYNEKDAELGRYLVNGVQSVAHCGDILKDIVFMVHELDKDRVVEPLFYGALKGVNTHMHITMLSYTGNLMYVQGSAGMDTAQALGASLQMMRMAHRSAWAMLPIVKNTYQIRRPVRQAIQGRLKYDDEYALVMPEELRCEIAEDAVKTLVAKATNDEGAVENDKYGEEFEEGQVNFSPFN